MQRCKASTMYDVFENKIQIVDQLEENQLGEN